MDHEQARIITLDLWTRYIFLRAGTGAVPEQKQNRTQVAGNVQPALIQSGNREFMVAE